MTNVRLIATGLFLPERIVRNEDFKTFPATAIPLIKEKIGIVSRHHVEKTEKLSDIAIKAALNCLGNSAISVEDIDGIILASSTPDRLTPSTSTRVQHSIGAKNAFAFDMNAACSNGVFTMEVARSLICSGAAKTMLVINGDVSSKFLNPRDFATYPYFGDGAGAVILQRTNDENGSFPELLPALLRTDGSGFDAVSITGGGSELPFYEKKTDADFYLHMNGKAIMEFATVKAPEIIDQYKKTHDIDLSLVSTFILHQANTNIIQKIADSLEQPKQKFIENIDSLGNTAGASLLITLAECIKKDRPQDGYWIICGFGAGLCWGACALKFNDH